MKGLHVLRVIDRGGMATVYEGERILADGVRQRVAIKRLRPSRKLDPAVVQQFRQEAELSLTFAHPHIVGAYHLSQDEHGDLGMVMELVSGASLEAVTDRAALTAPCVRTILRAVLEALVYIHERGVIHRDVTPRNVLLSRDGAIKLTDFGLAKLAGGAESGDGFKGTAEYASPEALRGLSVGQSADLYAVAAIGYRLLTGKPPFGTGNMVQIAHRQATWQLAPLPEDTPADVRALIDGALRYADEQRYKTAAEMLADLIAAAQPMASTHDIAAIAASVADQEHDRVLPNEVERADTEPYAARVPPAMRARKRPRLVAAALGGIGVVLAASYLAAVRLHIGGDNEHTENARRQRSVPPTAIISHGMSDKRAKYPDDAGRDGRTSVDYNPWELLANPPKSLMDKTPDTQSSNNHGDGAHRSRVLHGNRLPSRSTPGLAQREEGVSERAEMQGGAPEPAGHTAAREIRPTAQSSQAWVPAPELSFPPASVSQDGSFIEHPGISALSKLEAP